jgi:hypothetical protein
MTDRKIKNVGVIPYIIGLTNNVCSYTGKKTDGWVSVIGNHKLGIWCISECMKQAQIDCYKYCVENNKFPVNTYTEQLLSKYLKIKRTSGRFETNWTIKFPHNNNKAMAVSGIVESVESVESVGKSIYIGVYQNENKYEKFVSLNDLCEWNQLKIILVMHTLKRDLRAYYNITNCL